MSISETIGSVAASDPVAGAAVARQSVAGAILAGLQSGDQSASALLGAVFGQAQEVQQLLASLQPHLGQNVNTAA